MKKGIERFYQARWGVFNHFLPYIQNTAGTPGNAGAGQTAWSDCVAELDADRLARQLHEIGAGYYGITLMQGTADLIAPNQTFDRIAGVQPGTCCARRDLVLDLYRALHRYGIDLYLYFTGDGPWKDPVIGKKFGFTDPREAGVTEAFVQKWAAVLEEYAVRYKDKVQGWWIDGCYRKGINLYTDGLVSVYKAAVLKGNPEAIVSFNDGVKPALCRSFQADDYTAGEFVRFDYLPESRWVDGAQAHVFASIAEEREPGHNTAWGNNGLGISPEALTGFVRAAGKVGCVVTIDCGITRTGEIFPEQMEALRYMHAHLE